MTALVVRIPEGILLGGCREAVSSDELAAHYAVRHEVFVQEQHIFRTSDRDALDDLPGTIRLVAFAEGEIVGAVRLYPLDLQENRWKGDRLAVLPAYRTASFGADLVRLAVRTATREGGSAMDAMIQLANVGFFERLGWSKTGGPVGYAGRPHQPMSIQLWHDSLGG